MVRSEDRQKETAMARDLGRPSVTSSPTTVSQVAQEETHEKIELFKVVEKIEKEIVRTTMIAEKDKRDAMSSIANIKKLTEQLKSLSDNTFEPLEELRRCQSEGDLLNLPLSEIYSIGLPSPTPPAPIPTSFRAPPSPSSLSRSFDAENKSPNISPTVSPLNDSCMSKAAKSDLLNVKQEELARVRIRAKDEKERYFNLRAKEEALRKVLENEVAKRRKLSEDIQHGINRKEKEIQRLSMLAERDKRTGMSMRESIAAQKKTLQAFASARADKKPQLMKIINSCDNIELPAPLLSPASNTSSSTSPAPTPPSPLSLSSVSPYRKPGRTLSPVQELMRTDSCKEEELFRVSAIAEMEACRVAALKDKSNEVKEAIAMELQELEAEIDRKLKQLHEKQRAVHKIATRAEIERARACLLQEELESLTKTYADEKHSLPIKKSEFIPDKAYFAEFKELSELVPVSEISAPSKDKRAHAAPASFVQSPRIKQISFTESGIVYNQKLQDLATLERESLRLDEELARIKLVKEAEFARRKLLVEKVRDLKEEVAYNRYQGREVSRTF